MHIEWDGPEGPEGPEDRGGGIMRGVLLATAFDAHSRMWIALVMQSDGVTVEIYPTLAKMRRVDAP